MILGLSFCYFIGLLFLLIKKPFLVGEELNKKEKKQVNKFAMPLIATVLSGVFFANIDKIMLGHFVNPEFIGYYAASFSLIGSLIILLGFSVVLLPIFSRLGGKRLERGLKKSIKLVIPISIALMVFIILLAPIIIKLVYGKDYSMAINLLRFLSLLIFSGPLIAIQTTYFISKGKTKLIAKLLVSTTILNIILNYILISTLSKQSHFTATLGAVIATLISSFIYLGLLFFYKK